jgi:hypothetical protein
MTDSPTAPNDHEKLISRALPHPDSPVAAALYGYLSVTPLADTWADARERRSPLLCARRGSPSQWFHADVRYHRVVVQLSALVAWVAWRLFKGADFGGPVPGGAALHAQLLALPGVAAANSAVPLREPGNSRKLHNWFAVDPTLWPCQLSDAQRAVVDNPWMNPASTAPTGAEPAGPPTEAR